MKSVLTDPSHQRDSARSNAIREAVRKVGSISRRDRAAGRLVRHLCEVLDTHPGAALRFIDVGEGRAKIRPGTRVCRVSRECVRDTKSSIRLLGQALCSLDNRPRAYVLSSASSIALGDYAHAEAAARRGLSVFGVASEGAPLALSAAMAARERMDWAEAKRLYMSLHDCEVKSYKQAGFAAATLAAIEWDDRSAASHFYLALVSMGVADGRAMLSRVVLLRSSRGERRLAEGLYRRLNSLVGFRPLISHD